MHRPFIQFRLRTLLILVAVAAIPCGWLNWKMVRKDRERAAVAEIERLGWSVFYDWEDVENENPPGPAWLRNLFGDDFFADVVVAEFDGNPFSSASLSDVSDAELLHFKEFAGLKELDLRGTSVTDVGVTELQKALPNCRIER